MKNLYKTPFQNIIMSVIRKALSLLKKYRMQLVVVVIAMTAGLLYGYLMGFFNKVRNWINTSRGLPR